MAGEVKWIKIVVDIFDDEKILLIEAMPERDSLIVIWFKLLCLCGKTNNGGILMLNDRIAYTDEMLATIFRRPVNTVRLALSTFEQYGMIEIVNDCITIPNWNRHQDLDRIQLNKERNRQRVAAFRERQKLAMMPEKESAADADAQRNAQCNDYSNVTCNANEMLRNADVTPTEREGEREREGDNIIMGDKSPKKAPKRFVPPSVDEVRAYCQERGNNVDAERFVDYYTSNGWHVGKNPMKDWRAAVRTWERHGWNGYGYGGKTKKPSGAGSSIDMAEVDRLMNPDSSFSLDDFDLLVNRFPEQTNNA